MFISRVYGRKQTLIILTLALLISDHISGSSTFFWLSNIAFFGVRLHLRKSHGDQRPILFVAVMTACCLKYIHMHSHISQFLREDQQLRRTNLAFSDDSRKQRFQALCVYI